MGKIKELRKDVIEQIAAGEVVENPASIVKELIENAIDAGANKIFIELEEGGKKLIRVTDDGSGMTKDDASLSIKRHATSKVESLSDLFNIKTLGFRGEALAAISSVSQFELITKTDYAMEGTRIRLEDNEPVSETVACPKGTTIVVKEMFYNTPARKKHLRTNAYEASKVAEVITKYALVNPLIYFRLTVDGKQTLNAPNTPSLLNNIVDIYGNDVAKELLEVDYKDEIYNIKGYISKPSFSRSDKDFMNVFVNTRYVKNKTIHDAIYDSYHTLLHGQRYPFALLKIAIDPKKLDVNIHPNKLKIKIEQEGKLYEIIFDVVRSVLKENDITSKQKLPEEGKESPQPISQETQTAFEQPTPVIQEKTTIPERKYPVQEDTQQTFPAKEVPDVPKTIIASKEEVSLEKPKERTEYVEENNGSDKIIDTSQTTKMRILGQIYKTYIIIETREGLQVMDQHAAHERVLFDKILNETRTMKFGKQELLEPIELNLSVRETSAIESNKALLKEFGFDFENFGGNSYLLRSVPVIFKKTQGTDFFTDLVSDILQHARINALDKMKHELVSTMACRAAIKAGDELTNDQMKDIVTKFFSLDMSYTCPHGRPIMLEISIEELEKRFKRTGF
jgi:DNA mismatch repair protein MutL